MRFKKKENGKKSVYFFNVDNKFIMHDLDSM